MACAEPCPEGCDAACEVHAAWKPDPQRQHPGVDREPRAESMRFLPDRKGGGRVQVAPLSSWARLGPWSTVARKRPLLAAALLLAFGLASCASERPAFHLRPRIARCVAEGRMLTRTGDQIECPGPRRSR